jgi:hypothetical protein
MHRKAPADLGGETDRLIALEAIDAHRFEIVEHRQMDRLTGLRMELVHRRPCDTNKVELSQRELADFEGAHAYTIPIVGAPNEAMALERFEQTKDVVLGHAELTGELAQAELVRRTLERAQDIERPGDRGDGVISRRGGMLHRTALGYVIHRAARKQAAPMTWCSVSRICDR